MVEIRLSKAADNLIDFWLSTQARWGETQADNFLDDLDRALRLLEDNPRKDADCMHILCGMRRLIVTRHAAFYG